MLRLAPVALFAATLACSAAPAGAFELFGLKLFGGSRDVPEDFIGEPQHYAVETEIGGEDEDLRKLVENASSLVADQDDPASGAAGLIAKANADYARILAALYSAGHYGGAISIRIDGREAGELLPDASLADSAQVRIVVDPGPQFRFGRLNIVNPAPPALSEADEIDRKEAEGFAEGEVARSGVIRAAGRLEVEAWRQQGHPKAELAERRVEALHDRNLIEVTLVIDPGPKAQFGPVTVEGTERMDAEFVAYMADIPEGAEFDPDDLALAEERLQRLEVFASARAVEAEKVGPGGSLPISFIVQERLPRRFGIGGTLSTIDGAGVEAFWQHRNLFGRAERLRFDARIAGIGQTLKPDELTYRIGTSFVKPGVFTPDTNFIASISALRESPDLYTRTGVAAEAGFTHIVNKQLSGRLLFRTALDKFEDVLGTREFFSAGLVGAITHDSRDNAADATKGHLLEVTAEPFHEFRFGNTGMRATVEGRKYVGFGDDNRFVLAGRVKIGTLLGVPIAEAPPDKLFFAGGGGSVRGYGYNNIGVTNGGITTGGLSLIEASAEVRARITESIGIVGFVDAAQVGDTATPDFSGPFLVGVGGGVRYHTGLGPIRLDVAVPLDRRPGDPSVAAYIGIGQAF